MLRKTSLPAWQYKRCRAFLLLSNGCRITHVREQLGCADHNVRRWVRTYEAMGLEAALARAHGGGPSKKTSKSEEQRIVALVCGAPPEGYSRWSIRLLVEHVPNVLGGKKIGREKIRLILQNHDLKPWLKKNVVRARTER